MMQYYLASLRAKPKLDAIYRPLEPTTPNTKMSQDILDTKAAIRTLPRLPLGAYYERREAYLSPCFTPARVYARAAHHLPRAEYGVEPPDHQFLREPECSSFASKHQGTGAEPPSTPSHKCGTGRILMLLLKFVAFHSYKFLQNPHRLGLDCVKV